MEVIASGLVAQRAALFDLNEDVLRRKANNKLHSAAETINQSPLFEFCDPENAKPGLVPSRSEAGGIEHRPCFYLIDDCSHVYNHIELELCTGPEFREPQEHRAYRETDDHFTLMNLHDLEFTDRLAGDDLDVPFLNWDDPDDMAMLWPDPPLPTTPAAEETRRLVQLALETLPRRVATRPSDER